MEELVPVVEADELAYLELSEQDAELLIHVKNQMAAGVTAETVANWATWRYADKGTVALVIGAAHYIERAGKVE